MSVSQAGAVLVELSGADHGGHLVRVGAVPGAVLELDRGQEVLARPGDDLLAAATGERLGGDDLVLDAGVVQRFLHRPARVPEPVPRPAAAVELERHLRSS